MPKLKELSKARVYTDDMTKACIIKMVDKYHPEQAILLCTRTAVLRNQIRDPRWVKNQDPDLGSGSRMNMHHIFEIVPLLLFSAVK